MIQIDMVLHSAITRKTSQLVKINIINDGTGTIRKGNYSYTIRGKRNQLLKEGVIKNWSRIAKPPLALLQEVINDAYPPKIKIIKP